MSTSLLEASNCHRVRCANWKLQAVKLMLTASQHLYLVSKLVMGLRERLPSRTTADEHGELLVVCGVDSAIITAFAGCLHSFNAMFAL